MIVVTATCIMTWPEGRLASQGRSVLLLNPVEMTVLQATCAFCAAFLLRLKCADLVVRRSWA